MLTMVGGIIGAIRRSARGRFATRGIIVISVAIATRAPLDHAVGAAPAQRAISAGTAMCQRLLRLRRGNTGYLAAYGGLATFLFGRHAAGTIAAPAPKLGALLAKVKASPLAAADFQSVEASLMLGTPADLLWRKLLMTLQLNGRAKVSGNKGGGWTYIQRTTLADLYLAMARRLAGRGKKRQSYDAFRCWLFLLAQDEVAGSRLLWCNLNREVVNKYSMPPAVYRAVRAYFHAVYRSRVAFDRLLYSVPRVGRRKGNVPGRLSPAASRVAAAIGLAWTAAGGRIGWQYKVLREAENARRRALAFGRRRCLRALDQQLQAWRRRAATSRSLGRLRRQAILRWIKEAMGP